MKMVKILPEYNYPENLPTRDYQIPGYMNLVCEENRLGHNTGEFFVHFQEAFRTAPQYLGRAIRINRSEFPPLYFDRKNRKFRFKPDVIRRYQKGHEFDEAKACSGKAGFYLIPFSQIKGYFLELINRVESGDELPLVNFCLYNYHRGPRPKYDKKSEKPKKRRRSKNPKIRYGLAVCERYRQRCKEDQEELSSTKLTLHYCRPECLDENLAGGIRRGLILPFNLFLVLVSSELGQDPNNGNGFHRRKVHNQENSQHSHDFQKYVYFSTTAMSQFAGISNKRSQANSVEELLDNNPGINRELADKLRVCDLQVVRDQSPKNICSCVNGKSHQVRSFPLIRLVDNPKSHRFWLEYLRSNSEDIFRGLGFGELYDTSFKVEEFEEPEQVDEPEF